MRQRWPTVAYALSFAFLACGCDRQAAVIQPQPHPPAVPMSVPSTGNTVHVAFPKERVALSGITIIGTRREAWLSIDAHGPVPYGIGDQVLGATLVTIEPDFAAFETGGVSTRVSLAAASPSSVLAMKSVRPESETGLASILGPVSPNEPAMASAPPSQPSKGTGNAAFLEAIGKAQRDATGR